MKKLIYTFILIIPFIFNVPVHAQQDEQIFIPMGTDYDNKGAAVYRLLKERSFATTDKMPVGNVELSIIHPDYLEPNQFALLMKKTNSITDCFDYSALEYEANYIENYYMDIEVKHFRRTLNNTTQNSQFDCDTRSKVVSGMIVLNADDLKKRNVQQIRFSNGSARDIYNVTVTENSVRLTPESMIAFRATNLQGPDKRYIEYNFVDRSLIALQVPMARQGDDIAQSVRNLAYQSALQPVFKREGLDTSGTDNVFYFTDPNGLVLQQISKEGYTEFGTINVTRPYDGPYGRVGTPVPLKVFLTKPNVTL